MKCYVDTFSFEKSDLRKKGKIAFFVNSHIHFSLLLFIRSYAPPTRDEETETQRKARAKHARQTRRSTQVIWTCIVHYEFIIRKITINKIPSFFTLSMCENDGMVLVHD